MACVDLATAAGTTLAIGAALPATYNAAGYEDVTWTVLGELASLSAFGKEYQTVTWAGLSDRRSCKRKGTYDNGGVDVEVAHVAEDTGQAALLEHLDSDNPLPFRVLLNDTNATYDGTGTTFYFSGLTMSARVNPGSDPNGMVTMSARIEIDGDVVKVARAAE
jgi:hypothetical protein